MRMRMVVIVSVMMVTNAWPSPLPAGIGWADARTSRPVSTPLVPIRSSARLRICARPAQQDHFQTAVLVEMNVGCRHDRSRWWCCKSVSRREIRET